VRGAVFPQVSRDGLLVEEGELGLGLGAAVGGRLLVAEGVERLLGPAPGRERAVGRLLFPNEPVEAPGGVELGAAEVVEVAGVAAERGGAEGATRRGVADGSTSGSQRGEVLLLLPPRVDGASEGALGLLGLAFAEVENLL
jgi:hypothetical protein